MERLKGAAGGSGERLRKGFYVRLGFRGLGFRDQGLKFWGRLGVGVFRFAVWTSELYLRRFKMAVPNLATQQKMRRGGIRSVLTGAWQCWAWHSKGGLGSIRNPLPTGRTKA